MKGPQGPNGPLATKVRTLRDARGWTQQDLAVAAGLHTMTVSELERGSVETKLATLDAIAGAFELSVTDLLADPDPEPAEATP